MMVTAKAMNALRWFAARGEAGWFDKDAPSHSMRTRLVKRGLIEHVPDSRPVHFKRQRLTDQGREVLREHGWL